MSQFTRQLALAVWLVSMGSTVTAQSAEVNFEESDTQLEMSVNGKSVGVYLFQDNNISRPFFAHLKTPAGIQVTRNHPPQAGDRDDHATMHPGIWLAMGDLDGVDFWRNQATVKHVKFLQPPATEGNRGWFVEQKRYLRPDQSVVCDELFRFTLQAQSDSYLLMFESTFSADQPFYFGDQEEMGWGVRVATAISEINGGRLLDAKGREGAAAIWSHPAAWCDYRGSVDGQPAGVTLLCHPDNFRGSWFHARDYGLMVANAFGRAAMKHGKPSRLVVEPGKTLRLRYGVWIHAAAEVEQLDAAYQEYVTSNP